MWRPPGPIVGGRPQGALTCYLLPAMQATLFNRLAELAYDRAIDLACPRINGRSFYDPATRETAELAAREFETAAAFWRGICPRSVRNCLASARSMREGDTLADHGLI